jgi:hypothetical protein
MIFFAHDIAVWTGIPTALVVVIALIARKRIMERRRQDADR